MKNFLKKILSFLIRTDKRALIMRSLLLLTILASVNVLGYAFMQPKMVTGQITDQKTGEFLPGVNVVVEGTTTGVITDLVGKYSIEVPNEDAVLLISYIGYVRQKFPVRGITIINIQLSQEIKSIDEVVVVGYGTQRKANLTGSVGSVNVEKLQNRAITQASNMLSGQISGVSARLTSGQPGKITLK